MPENYNGVELNLPTDDKPWGPRENAAFHTIIDRIVGLENSDVTNFKQLSDTPDTYANQGSKVVSVKANESGLEFTSKVSSAGSSGAVQVAGTVAGSFDDSGLTASAGSIGFEGNRLSLSDGDLAIWKDGIPLIQMTGTDTNLRSPAGTKRLYVDNTGIKGNCTAQFGSAVVDSDVANLGQVKAIIATTVTNGDTTHSPSGDAVYDAIVAAGNAFVKLDQTTPQAIINGAMIVDGIQLDTTPGTTSSNTGYFGWDATNETAKLSMGGGVTQQIGEEIYNPLVKNMTGVTIPEGKAVYVNGRNGQFQTVALAKGDSLATSVVIGVTTQDITNNGTGRVTAFGYVRDIKTNYSTWAEGQTLWLSKTVAGDMVNVEPTVPHHSDIIGEVGIVAGAGAGSVMVRLNSHKTLDSLADVNGTALTVTGQFPVWNQSSSYFDFTENILHRQAYHGVFHDGTAYESTLAYDEVTRVVSFSGATTIYDQTGKKYSKTGNLLTIPDVSGTYFVSMNSAGVISASLTPWNQTLVSPIALVIHKVGGLSKCFDERHKYNRNPQDGAAMHKNIGTTLETKPAIAGYVLNGSTDADNSYNISSVVIRDEDITMVSRSKTDAGTISQINIDTGGFPSSSGAANAHGYVVGTTYPKRQASITGGGETEIIPVALGSYFNMYVIAATFLDNTYTYFVASGYQQWDKLSAADTAARSNATNALIGNDCPVFNKLATQEIVPFLKLTYFVKSTNTQIGKAQLVNVNEITGSRQQNVTQTSGVEATLQSVTLSGPTTDVAVSFTNTTASTSTTTGALTVAGGVGINGKLTANESYFGATGQTAIVIKGGNEIDLVGTDVDNQAMYFNWTGFANGATRFRDIIFGNGKSVQIAKLTGAAIGSAKLEINATTASTSTTTGALTVAGGVGFNKSVNVAEVVTSQATATTILAGAKNLTNVEAVKSLLGGTLTKTITLEAPTSAEDVTIFRTDVAITVLEVIAISTGTTPSTTYVLRHDTSRDAAGTLVTTSAATTSKTTGDTAALSDATIPANSWIWLETTAASGTSVALTVDIRYTID